MPSSKYSKVKFYYEQGLWNEIMVRNAIVKKWITQEEAEEILGTRPE